MFKNVYVRKRYCPIRLCVNNMGTPDGDGVTFFQWAFYSFSPRRFCWDTISDTAVSAHRTLLLLCKLHVLLCINRAPVYDYEVRDKWMENIQAHQEFDSNTTKIKVCELHFKPGDMVQGKQRKELKKGGYPTVFPERMYVRDFRSFHCQTLPSLNHFEHSHSRQ